MRLLFALFAFGILATHSVADTVLLTNGDRISGDIIELSNTSLKIQTPYAGTLSLNTSAIQNFHTDAKQHWQINLIAYNHLWLRSGSLDTEMDGWGSKLDYQQFWFDRKLETFADLQISHVYIDYLDYIINSSAGLRYYFTHYIHLSFKYNYDETKHSFGSIKDSSYVLGAGVNF